MDISRAVPRCATINALLFTIPELGFDAAGTKRFDVLGRSATMLLCLGITPDEFSACKVHNSRVVQRALREHGVFPFTDVHRESVLPAATR